MVLSAYRRAWLGCIVWVAGALAPYEGQAQEALSQARETYRAGVALEAAGDWGSALVKFREVAAVKLTPQVRFHIARCQEHLGRWTEALGTYRLAIGEAEVAGVEDARAEAEAARVSLEQRLPRLKLVRGAGAETALVWLDGVELGQSALVGELRVDPGPHEVVLRKVRDERYEPLARRRFSAMAGESQTVRLEVDPARAAAVPGASAGNEPASGASAAAVVPGASPRAARSKTLGYVLLGVGAGLGAGAGFLWTRRSATIDQLEERCVDGRCPASMGAVAERGQRFHWASVGVGAAAVGVLGLGVWKVLGSSEQGEPVTVGASLNGGPEVALRGAF